MAMAPASEKRKHKARVAAAISVTFVALFAMAFIGVVTLLNNYADQLEDKAGIEVGGDAPAEPFYVLLIGSDSRKGTAIYTGSAGGSQEGQYADIMTLMRVDPQTFTVTLVSIPRDTMLDGWNDKINSSLSDNDPERVVDAVAELTGVRADYYMMTTFISFQNLINALGGIDVDVPKTVSVVDPATGKKVTVKKGQSRHLNGSEALVLARARKEYDGEQDALRQVNVRNIERAMIQKVLDMDGDFDVEHVLAALEGDTKTNMSLPAAGLLMLQFVEHADEVTFYDCSGPYKGDNRESDGLWVVPDDEMTWETLMSVVDAGEDPSQVVKPPEFAD